MVLEINTIFSLADWVGSTAFVLSGIFIGIRKKLDIMGIFVVSMLTANGGGAVRDVLIGRTPQVFDNAYAFYLVVIAMIATSLFNLHRDVNLERRRWFILSDSIGLIAFSITGTLIALEYQLNFFAVVVLSFLTATGGGILRDVLVKEVPVVLQPGSFYGSVTIIVAIVLYMLTHYGFLNNISVLMVFVLALILRLVAYFKHWQLPVIN